MKNVSSLKSTNTSSPKTPGGISKSLLTPCRRLGLSRNWKRNGPSPFISPITSTSADVKVEKKETRKRKERVLDENNEETTVDSNVDKDEGNIENVDKTPSRNVDLPRRKKSKTLISAINKSQEDIETPSTVISEKCSEKESKQLSENIESQHIENIPVVSTPVRTKSKKSKKRSPVLKSSPQNQKIEFKQPNDTNSEKELKSKENQAEHTESTPGNSAEEAVYTIKENSPNELRKECIVVIQRKIFKNVENNNKTNSQKTMTYNEKSSTHDYDSDEAPLVNLKNVTQSKVNILPEDDDFIDSKPKAKSITIKETKSPKTKPKTTKLTKVKPETVITVPKPPSQSCFDDEDDDFDNKKTILVRKTYNKVSKPLKAKSTGSITQRDIDNLRNRIEAKKKLLLAQSVTPDTEELRTLIKKWQKGCQDALMELLELMRDKFPDNARMDYAEMLKALKIPASLVGYDSDNDCFNSPDDASIILGQYKDL